MQQLPDWVELHGIDIEPRVFPVNDPRVDARRNVTFSVASVTDLPEDWAGSFTFVHQRLLTSGSTLR